MTIIDTTDRSPCFNDKCLFKTSLDPFPLPQEVVFNNDLDSIEDQNVKFRALGYPTNEFFATYSYIHAVDNDPHTCWNSFKGMSLDAYFVICSIDRGVHLR